MSCFYKRICLRGKWRPRVVFIGEMWASGSSVNTEPQKTQVKLPQNEKHNPRENEQHISCLPDRFQKESSKISETIIGHYVFDTKFDRVYFYKDMKLCEICFLQQLSLTSGLALSRHIISPPHISSISASHRNLTHVYAKYCSKCIRPSVLKSNGLLGRYDVTKSLLRCKRWSPGGLFPVRSFTRSVEVKEEQVVSAQDIQKFLAASSMQFEQGFTCFISTCPKVAKLRPKATGKQKLYINTTTGHFLCEYCNRLGGWPELTDNVLLLRKHKRKKDYECFKDVDSVLVLDTEAKQGGELWNRGKSVADLSDDDFNQLVEDFDCEKLTVSTMTKYCVRYDLASRCLLFPVYNMQCSVTGVKRLLLKVSEDEVIKTTKDVLPRSGPVGLFGWNTVSPDTTTVVMTISTEDAMAVYQETKVHAVALPKGFSVLPQELLPSLEQFKKIILWFGDDIRAWEAAKQFAKKLGNKRCYVIRPSSDDPSPYAALCKGKRLRTILDKAKPIGHKSIVSFSTLRQEIFSELAHVEQVAGVKWKRFPTLNRILKGHRRGELTVFTGLTGSGKTTFISDYSLDLCMQGVNTLWGSFEINNVRLGKMMLTQFARLNLSKHLNEFDKWANLFEDLPMYFMTFHGQENIRNVVETMSHAVYVHDIAHVVVDNLQFMMGSNEEYVDKFSKQDMIVSAFRRFATKMNCHVTLVIHPRKEKEAEDLTTASIFGSAKASQEADNVLILQDKRLQSVRANKYLQITKNRFDGELGVMLLKFDKEAKGFSSRDKITKRESRHEERNEESKTQAVKQEEKPPDTSGGNWFSNK